MPDHERRAHIELDVNAGHERAVKAPDDDTPFRIVVLGDFSGDKSRSRAAPQAPLANRRPIPIDRDTVDEVIAHLAPEIVLERASGEAVIVPIASIDDFHPDHLYESLTLFTSLKAMRARLANPATFADAARELTYTHADDAFADKLRPDGVPPPGCTKLAKMPIIRMVKSVSTPSVTKNPAQMAPQDVPPRSRRRSPVTIPSTRVPAVPVVITPPMCAFMMQMCRF